MRDEIEALARKAARGDLRAAERLLGALRAREGGSEARAVERVVPEEEAREAFEARKPLKFAMGFDLDCFGRDWQDNVARKVLPAAHERKFELVDAAVVAPAGPHGVLLSVTFWPYFEGWMDHVHEAVREEFKSTLGSVLTTERIWIKSPARERREALLLEQPVDVRVVNMPGDGGAFRAQGDVGGVVEVEWTVELLGPAKPHVRCPVDPWIERALLEPGSNFYPGSARTSCWKAYLRADRRIVGDPPDHGWRSLSGQP